MTTNRAKVGGKRKAKITDRATANRAKVYVYGFKEHTRKKAVQKTNVCIAECMRSITPEPETETITESYTLSFVFRNSIRITVFILYLYMVWSYFST